MRAKQAHSSMLIAHSLPLGLAFVIELRAISYGPSERSPRPCPSYFLVGSSAGFTYVS